MAGNDLFLKSGFKVIDQAPPYYELLVKKFKKDAPLPRFKGDWDKRIESYGRGLILIRSDQCPYNTKITSEIIETAKKKYSLKAKVIELKSAKQAQKAPCAYSVFNIIYNGKLLADHPISSKRFQNIMNKICI